MSKKPVLSLDEFLPYRLSIAANAVSRLIAAAYARKFDLSIPEWRLIAVLHQEKSATQQQLVRRTMMDKVAVSRAAQSLAQRGLLHRDEHKHDGRAVHTTLTRAGRTLYTAIAPAALGYEQRLLADFSKTEIRQMNALLARLIEAALACEALDQPGAEMPRPGRKAAMNRGGDARHSRQARSHAKSHDRARPPALGRREKAAETRGRAGRGADAAPRGDRRP